MLYFLSHLAFTYTGYQSELESVEASTEITGVFTDIYGKQVKNVVLETYQLKDLYNSGYIEELNVSRATKYNYMGRFDRDSGIFIAAKLAIPDSPFAFETYFDNLQKGNWFVNTNNIKTTPEFYFSEKVDVKYMDGYGPDIFYAESEENLCCVISDTMMEEHSIEFGDIIQLDILRNYY